MVSQFSMQPMFRTTSLTVDTSQAQQRFYDEEEGSLLEDGVLSSSGLDSGLEMSPPMMESRRESFAVSSTMFSPKTEDWQSVEMQSVPSNNPFLEPPSNNPFMQQPMPFGPQTGAWPLSNGSGTCTPLQQFDGLPADFDGNAASIFQRPMQAQPGPFGIPAGQMNMFSAMNSNASSLTTSPQNEWLTQNQSMVKKMRPNSPALRSHNDMRRGDGIRKKNARFDIPAERNLNNIDQLISQSTDEQEIKELKQQKRLLRNRQAALDSRQRKKQHTERLEDEKKTYTVMMAETEQELEQERLNNASLHQQVQALKNHCDMLSMEKDEMIRAHTLETAALRKKISVLTDEVQRFQGAGMTSGMQGNNGFGTGFDDMDGMSMAGTWDNGGAFLGDFPLEPEVKVEKQMVKHSDISFPADSEKPANQSGLIFWLFLIGAFVISKGPSPSVPHVPEDVRATSATLLESVLKDAGVGAMPSGVEAMAPQPSSSAWAGPAAMTGADMNMPTMLGDIGDSLTQPTREQANEQAFSISAAQYNEVNPQDFLQNVPPRTVSHGRRNLADALAAMRTTNKASAADVYSRSLLWDQIPSDVVRDFARLVAEHNSAHNEQRTDSGT